MTRAEKPIPTKRYRHYKGDEYLVLHIATDSETMQARVIYTDGEKTWDRVMSGRNPETGKLCGWIDPTEEGIQRYFPSEDTVSWTKDDLTLFDNLTHLSSSFDQVERIEGRVGMSSFITTHGKEKCDSMWAFLVKRDGIKER